MPDRSLRDQVTSAIAQALRPLPGVLAGWEGGSAAFDALDAYSDLDLNVLVDDDVALDSLYAAAEDALATVSPITASHQAPPGRYYKLKDGGEYLLIDLCFIRASAQDHQLAVERHGRPRRLFDKGDWLRPRRLDEGALVAAREERYRDLRTWFPVSQSFVRKALLRGQHAEALGGYWGYTVKPLVELLRMRYCPVRWDFGMRYLDRDLPAAVSTQLKELVFVRDPEDLGAKLIEAGTWGLALLQELDADAQNRGDASRGKGRNE